MRCGFLWQLGAPAVPLVQLVVEWSTCAKSLPGLPLYFTVPRMAADETWSIPNYSGGVELACALTNTAFLMEAAIFLLRRYIKMSAKNSFLMLRLQFINVCGTMCSGSKLNGYLAIAWDQPCPFCQGWWLCEVNGDLGSSQSPSITGFLGSSLSHFLVWLHG